MKFASCDRREQGIAVVMVLYALTIFSVIAMTVPADEVLEAALASAAPNAEVSLYVSESAGQTGGSTGGGAFWSLTTTKRSKPPMTIRIAIPEGLRTDTTFPSSGWSYAVGLASGLRVCCDGGDGKCERDATAREPQYTVSMDPSVAAPDFFDGEPKRLLLNFAPSLVQSSNIDNAGDTYLIHTTPNSVQPLPGDEITYSEQSADDSTIACRIENRGRSLANGALRLTRVARPEVPANEPDWLSQGTLDLTYHK